MLRRFSNLGLIFALITLPGALSAKEKHPQKANAQDQIQVVAHIPGNGEHVVRFMTTEHYRRTYLYAEHESGKTVTLIDITNLNSPTVLAEVSDPDGSADNLVAVAGNAALVSVSSPASPSASDAQTFRIMSFADPMHPSVEQEFKGVTAMARDEQRGLIFLANSDGIWILQQQFAPDPQAEKEWEHMMLDAR